MAKRVLLGKESSNYVLKVSKPGVDVIDDTINDRDYLFNSEMYRAGVIRSNSEYSTMTTSGVDLPTTSDSSGNAYIPAFIISEKGAFYPQSSFDEAYGSGGTSGGARAATFINCLSTAAGGGMFQFSLNSSGTTKNKVIPYEADAEFMTDPRPGEGDGTYPFLQARSRASTDGAVKVQILGIPCQFGKMINSATLFGTSVLSGSTVTGGGGTSGGGGTLSAPTISSVSRTARNNTNDTVSVNASAGTNNSGTITYAQSTTDSASGATFGSSNSFSHPRGTTRYYFAKQSNLISDTSGGGNTNHVFVSAAVDNTPSGFNNLTATAASGSAGVATYTIAGLGTGDTASVSASGNGSPSASSGVNGTTITFSLNATGSGGNTTQCNITVGTITRTFTVTTSDSITFNPSDFTDATSNIQPGATVDSNAITVGGISSAVSVTTSGCTVSIAGGSFQSSGSVSNNQTVVIRSTASSSFGATTTPSVTIDGNTINQTVTTRTASSATAPNSVTATQSTNTNDASQTITLSASGGSGTLQFSNDNSNFGTGTTFSQTRNTTVTYYARTTAEAGNSASVSVSNFVPPVFDLGSQADQSNVSSGTSSFNIALPAVGNAALFAYSQNASTYGSYSLSASASTNPGSMLSNVAINNTTGRVTGNIGTNTGSARTGTITVSVSTSKGGSDSDSFDLPQSAAATNLWEVGITQASYNFLGTVYHGYDNTGFLFGLFPYGTVTDTTCDLYSGAPKWGFHDIETNNTNTFFTVQSTVSNTGWNTLKIYSGTSTSGTLTATLSRSSLSFTSAGLAGYALWDLGADYTSGSGNLYLAFS